jgi:hypothetical protein
MAPNRYEAPFYKPPEVKTRYPHPINSGQIVLYRDPNWNSQSLTIDTDSSQYPPGRPFSFSGTPMNDAATWIAFRLPAGTVCTLVQHVMQSPPPAPPPPEKPSGSDSGPSDIYNPYNFAHAGICVDLIGNGEVQTVDLEAYEANDCLSGGIWRQVDLTTGWFQLFEHFECAGRFNTIFFGEWTASKPHALTNWTLNGAGSSANYPCLTPPQKLFLTVNPNGPGQQLALGAKNRFGTWDNKATIDFRDSGMNDRIQAFQYSLLEPARAKIESVTQQYKVPIGQTFAQNFTTVNRSDAKIECSVLVAQGNKTTVFSETTLAYAMSLGVSQTTTVKLGIKGIGEVSGSITTSFEAKASQTTSRSYTEEESSDLSQEITFTAPPWKEYFGSATISTGSLSGMTVTTTGQFYYDQELPGATEVQEGNRTFYLLSNPVTVVLSGGVASQVDVAVTEKDIPH